MPLMGSGRVIMGGAMLLSVLAAATGETQSPRTVKPVLHGRHWVAITGKPLAATAGALIFAKGGNAVDAAAAMLAASCTMWDTLGWGGETQALVFDPRTKRVIGLNALGVPGHVAQRNAAYERRSRLAHDLLKDVPGILVNQTNGAFYLTVMFRRNALTPNQRLTVPNGKAKEMVERIVKNVALDKRFVYYLLAATGICVVPLTGFNCDLRGFRVTLLESDDRKFEWVFLTLRDKVTEYLNS